MISIAMFCSKNISIINLWQLLVLDDLNINYITYSSLANEFVVRLLKISASIHNCCLLLIQQSKKTGNTSQVY